jgi:biopolymer transport protein ExbB
MSTMQAWYREGGPIMLLIALVGVAGLAILIERLYVIVFRSKNNGRVFIERVIQLVRVGRIEEAIKVCAGSTAALPDIGLLILRSRSRDESDLQNVAAAALLFVVPKLTRRLQYLRSLAVAAILLGLLGTARGIHDTLIGAAAAAARGEQMIAGLGASLTPTMFGLAVSRQPIGVHHQGDSRILRAPHQRAHRPPRRSARPSLISFLA